MGMKIPTTARCEQIFRDYAVPDPICRHCRKVREVGVFLAEELAKADVSINVPLVEIGCLLHDAFKAASLPTLEAKPEFGYPGPTDQELAMWRTLRKKYAGVHETLVAADILREEFPELAKFIAKIGSVGNPTYLVEGVELKVLHYADWRVQFDTVISFEERLSYLKEAYLAKWIDRGAGWWSETLERERKLERDIFSCLNFSPDELGPLVAALAAQSGRGKK